MSIDNTYTGYEKIAVMRTDGADQNSSAKEDLDDINILKNLLELQSRLRAKTDSMENEAD